MPLVCRVCHRELTRPESRALGVGPVCVGREGCEAPRYAGGMPRVRIFDGMRPAEPDPRQLGMLLLVPTSAAVQLELPYSAAGASSTGAGASHSGAMGPPTSSASSGTPRTSATRSQDALPL